MTATATLRANGEVRCACHRLLARYDGATGTVVLCCPRCKAETSLRIDRITAARPDARLELTFKPRV